MIYGIASDRPWNRDLARRLEARTGSSFLSIQRKEELKPTWLEARKIGTIFLPHWSHKIAPEVFNCFECIIFHMTDLPFGRGGSPLQNLIARGYSETVMSAIRCVRDLDAGPVYLKRNLCLHGTAEEIFLRADGLIEEMIITLIKNRPEPTPQLGAPTIFRRRRPEDGDWSSAQSLCEVFDRIRMMDAEGYPPAFIKVGRWRLSFSRAARRTDAVHAEVCIELRPDDEETRK